MATVSLLLLTALTTLMMPIVLLVKLLCLFLLAVIGQHLIREVLLQNRTMIIAFKPYQNDWQVTVDNQVVIAKLLSDSVVTHYVSVLRFQLLVSKKTLSCVIFRDSLAKDHYQCLLMALKMRRQTNDPPDVAYHAHQLRQK